MVCGGGLGEQVHGGGDEAASGAVGGDETPAGRTSTGRRGGGASHAMGEYGKDVAGRSGGKGGWESAGLGGGKEEASGTGGHGGGGECSGRVGEWRGVGGDRLSESA